MTLVLGTILALNVSANAPNTESDTFLKYKSQIEQLNQPNVVKMDGVDAEIFALIRSLPEWQYDTYQEDSLLMNYWQKGAFKAVISKSLSTTANEEEMKKSIIRAFEAKNTFTYIPVKCQLELVVSVGIHVTTNTAYFLIRPKDGLNSYDKCGKNIDSLKSGERYSVDDFSISYLAKLKGKN